MPMKFKDSLPENDHAGLLALGLVLLIIGQVLSNSTQPLLLVLRYVFFAVAMINYGYVLYLYNRDRIAREKEQRKN